MEPEQAQRRAEQTWIEWQMIDSMFPTGGFAHSLGLEAAVQEKLVVASSSGESLRQFLISSLHQAGNFALPMVHTMMSSSSLTAERFLEVNAYAQALFTNHVAAKASLAQGAALLRLAMSTYSRVLSPNGEPSVLLSIRKQLRARKDPGPHFPVMFGLVCGLLRLDGHTCQRMFLYFTLRDLLSAATRLNLIGPLEAANIQFEMRNEAERVFQAKRDRPIESAYSSAPILDLVQGMHDQLYTRIFNS
ncbi:TPA: hypothetical protein N0F65_001351 [Lagenidium giganteum]|uniref:Urease accessory protein UreF n=1 Tax=Lagenidium giganteum TaxID=4803 RepID=A0AAV2YW86_9STRA|nr:TPA: hypothetical protein N0F65_001351 [Lagenidium giganteum]